MKKLLLSFAILFFIFCNKSKNVEYSLFYQDSVKSFTEKMKKQANAGYKKMRERRDQDIEWALDSIGRQRALGDALSLVYKNKGSRYFAKEYVFDKDTIIDGEEYNYSVKVSLKYGNLFSTPNKYLILQRSSNLVLGSYLDFYMLNDGHLLALASIDRYHSMEDTIRDINGDGLKDLDIWWYPPSGCCRRNIHTVFLQKTNGNFTEEYEFVNPNFYPEEKLVRGLTYGYDSQLYKYRWNGFRVDTIEYVFRTYNHNLDKEDFYKINAKGDTVKIKNIPKEYLSLDDFDSMGTVTLDE